MQVPTMSEKNFICIYCGQQCKNKNSYSNHTLRCSKNPNRDSSLIGHMSGKKGSNQHIKGTAKPVTESQRQKLSDNAKGRKWTTESKKKLSKSMKIAVDNNPESYNSSNRGRTKEVLYDGIKFHGNWEVEFYKWAKENDLDPQRNSKAFEYSWQGTRKYFPDFYLPALNAYVEVKGYETERDHCKWEDFPETLYIVKKAEIEK